jgi:bifunctional oligoribonuclease and PAP phosphatase NrnA
MNENLFQDAKRLIDKAENILLLNPKKPDGDSLGALFAFYRYFEKQGKKVTALCPDTVAGVYEFLLPSDKTLVSSIEENTDIVLSVDILESNISNMKYTISDGKLQIIISPKDHIDINSSIVKVAKNEMKFDLIMAFDFGNIHQMGDIHTKYKKFFDNTPLILLDHHVTNEGFGTLNIVDTNVSSTCEIVYELLSYLDPKHTFFDNHIATAILTGIIFDTGSFQHQNTSPKALDIAGDLMDLGADQRKIVTEIYKNKQLETLKIWGRILSRIEKDDAFRLVWSYIQKDDFIELGAQPEHTEGVIDELMMGAPGIDMALLAVQIDQNTLKISMRSNTKSVDTHAIAEAFGGGGHVQSSGFVTKIHTNPLETIANIIKEVRAYQAKRLGLQEVFKKQYAIQPPVQKKEEKSIPYIPIKKKNNHSDNSKKMIDIDLSLDKA